ncbi:transposase domain-containing protein [Bradyrhizobium hereditatis]|uniref:transposase domain-containing protein n=1 Tax=Bradyrhizobium hereditatis TaxID=2821405 RepID=UPI0035DD7460
MNGVDPHVWLIQAIERIAQGWPISQIDALMLWNPQSLNHSATLTQRGGEMGRRFRSKPPNPEHYCFASDGSAKHWAHRVWIKRVLRRVWQKLLAP